MLVLVLVLLGCQALASEWKGEENLEAMHLESLQAEANQELDPAIVRWFRSMIVTVRGVVWWQNVKFDGDIFFSFLEKMQNRQFQIRNVTTTHVDGGILIHGTADDQTLCAYYHPTRRHRSGIQSGCTGAFFPYPTWQNWADAGRWAVACGQILCPEYRPLYELG